MPSPASLAELKEKIQEQLDTQIKLANQHLESLKGLAERAHAQAVADLRAKKDAAERQLRALKQSGDEQWQRIRTAGEQAAADLKTAVAKFAAGIKKG